MVNLENLSKVYKRSIINLFGQEGPCCLCGAPAPLDDGICPVCVAAMPGLRGPSCRCGLPWTGQDRPPEERICGRCVGDIPPFASVRAVFHYDSPLSGIIRRYKHDRRLHLERPLLALWREALASAGPVDALVPVPCHWQRRWRRGFSPAERLARALSDAFGVAVLPALARSRATPSQQGRGRRQRRRNLHGSMVLRLPVRGLHLALVDDVMTTGATVREAARVLREGDADRVDVWVLARTPENP